MRSQQAGEVSRKPIAESPVGTGPPPGLAGTAKRSLGSTFASLAVPNYRLMFQGNFVTHLGFGMQQVAFGWLILELTNDPFYLGLGGFTMMFPMLVISPFGGIIADRFPRQRVLMASQSLLTAIAVLLAALVYFRLATVWHLLALSFLNGTLMSLNVPSRNALLSDIVGRDLLANAISLYSLSLNVSRIAGPSLAGAIIGAVGTFACFLFQAFGYVWSVANIAMMKVPARPLAARQFSVMQNLVEGFRYCYRTPLVFSMLLLGSAVSILAMPAYMQLLPAYARDTLGLGPEGLGLLMSVAGIGALTSSFGLVLAGRFRRRGLLQLGAALTMGVLLCALAMIRWVPLASLALAGVSAGSSIMMILNNTVLQEVVPDHLRGRVMSVYMITWGIMPLGAVPLGAIAARWSTPTAMLIGGAGCVAAALWIGLTRPEIRQV